MCFTSHVRRPNFHHCSCQNHVLNLHLAKRLIRVTRISLSSVSYHFVNYFLYCDQPELNLYDSPDLFP